jgi:hypothetical protein
MKHRALGEHLTDLELRYMGRHCRVCSTHESRLRLASDLWALSYSMLEPPDRARCDLEGYTYYT